MASKVVSETAADGTVTTVTAVTTATATVTTTTVIQPNAATSSSHAAAPVVLDAETKKQDRDAFVGLFDTLVKEVIDEVRSFGDYDEVAIAWFKEVCSLLDAFLYLTADVAFWGVSAYFPRSSIEFAHSLI